MNLGEHKEQDFTADVPDYSAPEWHKENDDVEEYEDTTMDDVVPYLYPDHDYDDPMGYNSDSYMNYLNVDR